MPSNFEWNTEKGLEWEDEVVPQVENPHNRRRRRWRLVIVSLTGLMLIGALGLYWRLNSVATEVETAAKDEILASFQLLWQADGQRDLELFRSLRVETYQENWSKNLDDLFSAGLFFDRGMIGFQQPSKPAIIDIALAPDFQSAEMTIEQQFVVSLEGGKNETTSLQQILYYELIGSNWLLAPRNEEFWGGNWKSVEVGYDLKLFYSPRDAEITGRLGFDLDEFVGRFCGETRNTLSFTLECPHQRPIDISFRREVQSLLDLVRDTQGGVFYGMGSVYLPSPILVGLPQDETGYQSLYRHYAIQLADALLRPQPGDFKAQTIYRTPYYWALLNRFFVESGARSWPLVDVEGNTAVLDPAPEQNVVLMCINPASAGVDLLVYDPTKRTWNVSLEDSPYHLMNGAMDGTAILLQTNTNNEESPVYALMWPDGQEMKLIPPPFPDEWSIQSPILNPSYILWQGYPPNYRKEQNYILNLTNCRHGSCEWQELPGRPFWSPSGQQMLLAEYSTGDLWLGDGSGASLINIGPGLNPTWLNEEEYIFIKPASETNIDIFASNLYVGNIHDDTSHLLVNGQILKGVLLANVGKNVEELMIIPEFLFLEGENQVSVLVVDSSSLVADSDPKVFRFFVDTRSGEISYELVIADDIDDGFFGGREQSGRLASRTENNQSQFTTSLFWTDKRGEVYETNDLDLPSGWGISYFNGGLIQAYLSPDGRWVTGLVDGVLLILSADQEVHQFIQPEHPGCYSAVWINKK